MGDFYYELSVKVAEVCFATRSQNGGIMPVNQCLQILNSRSAKYNAGDIKIAVKKLGQLGGGFRIVQVGGGGNSNGDGSGSGIGLSRKTRPSSSSSTDMIISVPTELDEDHTSILTLASGQGGCVTVDDVQQQLGNWSMERIDRALTLLLQEGMAWKDDFHGIEYYWFPSIWKEQRQEQEEQEQQR
jgi:ESCRT-II complex subunit VPS22